MSTADKLQQLRLERQKSDLSYKLQALQSQLERCEEEKCALAAESGNKIKQALSLLDTARKEIDKLKREKEALSLEVTDLRRQNEGLRSSSAAPPASIDVGKLGPKPTPLNLNENSKPSGVSQVTKSNSLSNGGCAPETLAPQRNGAVTDEARRLDNTDADSYESVEEEPENTAARIRNRAVTRRTSRVSLEKDQEKPMSMAERMNMFEKTPGRKSVVGGSATSSFGKGTKNKPNASTPIKIKMVDEKKEEADTVSSPVARRTAKAASKKALDNRHTMPPNMYSPQQVARAAPPAVNSPTPATPAAPVASVNNTAADPPPATAGARGRAKLRSAFGGMKAAIETEKQHKGIPSPGGFMGLINAVAPKNPVKRAQSVAAPGSAQSKKQALLHWCRRMTEEKDNVDIKNFSSSWSNGMAFCALFHNFIPDQIPYESLDPSNREYNFRLAFTEGEKAGVTSLLDVEDMVDMKNPEWMSVMTYISLIYNHFNGIRVGGPRLPPMPGQE